MNTQDRQIFHDPASDNGAAQTTALAMTIWRGRWRILLMSCLAILLGAIYVFVLATPIFKSDVFLVLETREEQVVDLEGVISGLSADASVVQTEVEVLRSRGLAQKVVAKLDLASDPEFNPVLRPATPLDRLRALTGAALPFLAHLNLPVRSAAQAEAIVVSELLQNLTVHNVGDSLVFQLTVASTDPGKAARIANAFAEAYILDQLQVKYDATRQATVWLTERVSELKSALEQAEAAVKSFQSSTDLIDAETLALLDRQMKEVRDRLDTAQTDLATARAFETQISTVTDPAVLADLTGDALLRRLIPQGGADVDNRVTQIKARARLETERAANRVNALGASVQTLEGQISSQSKDLITLEQLTREADASRLLYEYFLNRLKETSAQQGIQQADSRVLSSAVAPIEAALPRIPLVLAAAAMMGVLLGATLVLRRAALTGHGFRTGQDLERLTGKPVMGEIPLLQARGRRGFFRYIQTNPVSATAEALRNLRTSVVMSNVDTPPRVIVVSSALAGEGKTAVSLALAKQLADLGKKVLLIEAETRQGTLLDYLGIPHQGPTLTEVLNDGIDWRAALMSQIVPRLDVLPGGRHRNNAPELLAGTGFSDLTDAVRAEYDMVVIDTAPVLLVSDARIIARVADTILFVVRWDRTSQQQVQDGIDKFESLGHRVTGLVLSQVDPKGMRQYGYGQTYGAYAAYGTDYFKT